MTREREGRPGLVVLWGLLAHAPFGGMTWQVVNHLEGLRRLGYEVWYVEDSDQRLLTLRVDDWAEDPDENVAYLARQLEPLGMVDRWVLRIPGGRSCAGALDWEGLLQLYRDADVVLNLCGAHRLLPHHDQIRHLLYLETDPISNQVGVALGSERTLEQLRRYDLIATYGTNLGRASCPVPMERFPWVTTVPPVATGLWRTSSPPTNPAFTTVMNWSSPEGEVVWGEHRWAWSKRPSFERFLTTPLHTDVPLEVAIRGAPTSTLTELAAHRWSLCDARSLDDPDRYRAYIRTSAGEFSVAKEQYVGPRSGWISDRTVCYLAAGRPAIVERTGIHGVPVGEGLLDVGSVDEAAAALEEVARAPDRHAHAAVELAEEHFRADRVLGALLDLVGASTRPPVAVGEAP